MFEIEVIAAPLLQGAEVVERKGIGHPDTMADALSDALSRALCRRYRERFGALLHHNVDKALLVGGASEPRFGGGRMLEQIEVLLAGRATTELAGAHIDLDALVDETVATWLGANMRYLDPDAHVKVGHRIRAGSGDLRSLFASPGLANDTSFGVARAPRSSLEQLVIAVERALATERASFPAFGEDTKVLGVSRAGKVELTVALAVVDRHVADLAAYEQAMERALAVVARVAPAARAAVNGGDDVASGRVYLTVTGTSLEAGDDGQVGRGNRLSGLITPCRAMSLEAPAGKNPITHVGKLYNVVAARVCDRLVRHPGVLEAECLLVSRIGRPVREPWFAQVKLCSDGGGLPPEHELAARRELERALDELPAITDGLIDGTIRGY